MDGGLDGCCAWIAVWGGYFADGRKLGKLTTIVSDSRLLKDLERYQKVCQPLPGYYDSTIRILCASQSRRPKPMLKIKLCWNSPDGRSVEPGIKDHA
jgi:hypothetical protein